MSRFVLPARPAAGALLLLSTLAAGLGWPRVWLVAALLLTALSLAAASGSAAPSGAGDPLLLPVSSRSLLSCLGLAALSLMLVVLILLLGCGWAHLPLLHHVLAARLLLGSVTLAAGLAGVRTALRVSLATPGELATSLPAAGLLASLFVLSSSPLRELGWFFRGYDSRAHVILVAGVRQTGSLSYAPGHDTYPRLIHAFAALLRAAVDGAPRTSSELLTTARQLGELEWGCWALVALVAGLGARALVRGLLAAPLSPAGARIAACAGLAAAAQMCTAGFFSFTLDYGFATSTLLALVLGVWLLEILTRPPGPGSLIVASMVLLAVSHTWQLPLPGLSLAWVVVAVSWWRGGHSQWGWVVLTATLACTLSLPPLLGLVRVIGVGAIAQYGGSGDISLPLAVLVGLSCVLLAGYLLTRMCTPPSGVLASGAPAQPHSGALLAAALPLLVGLTALGLAHLSHVSLQSYYPHKLTWNAAALGIVVLWGCVGALVIPLLSWWAQVSLPGWVRASLQVSVLSLGGTAVVLAAVLVTQPVLHTLRDGERYSPSLVVAALTDPRAPRAQAAWGLNSRDPAQGEYERGLVEYLVKFWHLRGDQIPADVRPADRDDLCAHLRAVSRTVVLSASSLDTYSYRSGCPRAVLAKVEWLQLGH